MYGFPTSVHALLLLAAVSTAQQPVALPKAPDAPLTVPAGEVHIKQLLELVAGYARCSILCEPLVGAPRPISLTEPVRIDRASWTETLNNLLWSQNLGLMPVDEQKGVFEVISFTGPRQRELTAAATVRSVVEVLGSPDSKRFIMTTMPLKYIDGEEMARLLRPVLPTSLALNPGGKNASIIVRGLQYQVAAALRLIQDNDRPGTAPEDRKLADRIAELEKQVADLKEQIASLQKAVSGK